VAQSTLVLLVGMIFMISNKQNFFSEIYVKCNKVEWEGKRSPIKWHERRCVRGFLIRVLNENFEKLKKISQRYNFLHRYGCERRLWKCAGARARRKHSIRAGALTQGSA
jgi:hypothetical protein